MSEDMTMVFMDALLYAMEGENPSKAIENQEARGQRDVVRNQRLPKKMNDHSVPHEILWNGIEYNPNGNNDWGEITRVQTKNNIDYTRAQYEKMNIQIVDEYDDIFYNVTLPEGWEIKPTDHSMWNELFDDEGSKRANFFYKAAFYDRDAFINFKTRYTTEVTHVGDPNDYDAWSKSDMIGLVKDGDIIIYKTDTYFTPVEYVDQMILRDKLYEVLEDYMKEHYPEYKDIHAYWD